MKSLNSKTMIVILLFGFWMATPEKRVLAGTVSASLEADPLWGIIFPALSEGADEDCPDHSKAQSCKYTYSWTQTNYYGFTDDPPEPGFAPRVRCRITSFDYSAPLVLDPKLKCPLDTVPPQTNLAACGWSGKVSQKCEDPKTKKVKCSGNECVIDLGYIVLKGQTPTELCDKEYAKTDSRFRKTADSLANKLKPSDETIARTYTCVGYSKQSPEGDLVPLGDEDGE